MIELILFFCFSIILPYHIFNIIGFFMKNEKPCTNDKLKNKVIFVIPSIAKNDKVISLNRVIKSILEYAPKYLENFRIDVVVEEDSEIEKILKNDKVNIIVVPKNYETKNKAKYKARALQYALELRRKNGENTKDIWIFHLDDDSEVREDTIKGIVEFIKKGRGEVGMCYLKFRINETPSFFCKAADCIRTGIDFGIYKFFAKIGRPYAGIHGEGLLVRADIEDKIGWDFKTLSEDMAFALKLIGKCKFSHLFAYVYNLPPFNLNDLGKQRGRWYRGSLQVLFIKDIPLKNKIFLIYIWTTYFISIFIIILALIYKVKSNIFIIISCLIIYLSLLMVALKGFFENKEFLKSKKEEILLFFFILFFSIFIVMFEWLLGIINSIKIKGYEVIRKA